MSLVDRMLRRAPRQTAAMTLQHEREPPRLNPALPPRLHPLSTGPSSSKAPADDLVADQSKQYTLREVFTPTRPQRSARRLTGRQTELLRIFRAIALDRAHVVLYGERGRGKTSLVNLVSSAARSSGYMVGRYTCASDSKFDDIVRGLVRDLPKSMLASPVVDDDTLEGCEAVLPSGRIQPRDIVGLPGRLTGRHVVLIADEFDRVEDLTTRTLFADTIKQASDKGAAISFVIVGVSDSLEELLGRHPSIQRNIVGVALPLLRNEDIEEILVQGGRDAGLEFSDFVRQAICFVAWGVPYVAQLLGLHSGTEALLRQSTIVEMQDLNAAFSRAIEEIDPRVAAMYQNVTDGGNDRAMLNTLLTLASGEQDRYARFVVSDRVRARQRPERRIEPIAWTHLLEAGMVRPCPSVGPDTFAFAEPMLQHYILMRAAVNGEL